MSEENLLEIIKIMGGQISHLEKQVHLQMAQIQALRIYSVARISDLHQVNRQSEFDKVSKMTRELYDKHISTLEAISPRLAADVDLRESMSPQDQEAWYLLEKYYPKQGDQPPG